VKDTPSTTDAVDQLLTGGSGRRPRADARRNLERLVSAARVAITEVGVDVTAHEIARRAGVGIGTFYRRVPSRETLLEAVLIDMINDTTGRARLAMADPDPWHGFSTFAADLVRLHADSRGIANALGGRCGTALDQPLTALREEIRRLVERAQAACAMRTDVAWQDIPFMLIAAATGEQTLGLRAGTEQWRRNFRILLDGLRHEHTGPTADMPGDAPTDARGRPR